MQRARFWILCAMGALLVISGILLFGARYWAMNAKALKNMLPDQVDMRLDNLTLNEAGADGRTMIINADSAQYFKSQDLFVLDRVRARILTDQGDYDIESDAGRYDQSQRVVDLSGNIKVVDGDGGVLITKALTLKFGEGLLISEEEFCYSTPEADLEGKSFVFHTREKILQVEGRTHLLFQ
jgi:Organic solvent tolerance protein OstA